MDKECINPEGKEGVCYAYDRLENLACMQCGKNKERAKQGFIDISRGLSKSIEEEQENNRIPKQISKALRNRKR